MIRINKESMKLSNVICNRLTAYLHIMFPTLDGSRCISSSEKFSFSSLQSKKKKCLYRCISVRSLSSIHCDDTRQIPPRLCSQQQSYTEKDVWNVDCDSPPLPRKPLYAPWPQESYEWTSFVHAHSGNTLKNPPLLEFFYSQVPTNVTLQIHFTCPLPRH